MAEAPWLTRLGTSMRTLVQPTGKTSLDSFNKFQDRSLMVVTIPTSMPIDVLATPGPELMLPARTSHRATYRDIYSHLVASKGTIGWSLGGPETDLQ